MKFRKHGGVIKKFRIGYKKYQEIEIWKKQYDTLVISGDFNSFPDLCGFNQLPLMNSLCKTYTATECAIYSCNKKLATKTFRGYPYEIMQKLIIKTANQIYFGPKYDLISEEPSLVDDRKLSRLPFSPSNHYSVIVNLQ